MATDLSGTKGAPARRRGEAEADEGARENILSVATEEFAAHGLTGARVDAIAERTRTTKGMIYYYFGSKERLYIAVLERAYLSIRSAESTESVLRLPPVEAATALVEASFDFHARNPHVGRLISIENINNARYARLAPRIRAENRSAVSSWDEILRAGRAAGLFRSDIEAIDLHALVSSLCVFRVTNRSTFQAIFDVDFADPATRERHRRFVIEMVLGLLRTRGPDVTAKPGGGRRRRSTPASADPAKAVS